MKRMKFNLVIGSIISALALSSCAKDFSLNSTKQICIDYLNAGPLSGLNTRHSGRKAELEKRGVTTCGPYEAEAEAEKKRKSAAQGDAWKNLSKTLKDAQKSLGCSQWTFNKYGVKQCLN